MKRILVVKLADLGDLLTATPAIRALRLAHPQAHLGALVTPKSAPILAATDLVDEINAAFPRWFQLFLGTAEVLAGVGLTVPGIVRVFPSLVTWAAVGIMLIMVPATIFHIVRSEFSSAAITAVLLVMATFVAYMRFRVLPIRSRHAGVPAGSRAHI